MYSCEHLAPVSYRDGVPCGSVRLATGGCDHTAGISDIVMWFIESSLWFIHGTAMIDTTCCKDIHYIRTIEDIEVDIESTMVVI